MKKILAAIMVGSCFCAVADTLPAGFWPKGEIVSGHVVKFEDFAGHKNNLAIIKLNKINIPQQYAADTRNCKAYLINDGAAWNLLRLQCDYQDNKEVRIYYNATVDVPPLNIGDGINISSTTEVPIYGYYKGFVFTREVK
jgi:hypothetical protein